MWHSGEGRTAPIEIVTWTESRSSIGLRVGRWDPAETAAHARAEDVSQRVADLIVVSASVCSLVPVGLTILSAGRHHGSDKVLLILLAISVVALSWALVHTVYALRYGDLYYATPTGGIDFNAAGSRSTATSPTSRSRSA